MSGYKRPGSSWQERDAACERPSSATTWRPPKGRKEFFGNLAEITKKSLVAAVQNVQRCNIMGDNLWKCWVEQFGGTFNDPNKYDSDFLEAFVGSCEGVTFCVEEHGKLAAAISDGSVKKLRLTEGLPAAMVGPAKAWHTAKARTATAPTTAAPPEAAAEAEQTAPSSAAAEQAAPTTAAAPEAAATEAGSIIEQLPTEDDEIHVRPGLHCIPVKVEFPWGRIPKFIYVSAPSYEELDDWYQKHWLSLEERSPGWRVCFIGDNLMCDMIEAECNPREVRAFKALNPKYGPARADFLRYHLMRSRGGMWLDAKSGFTGVLEKNLAKWLPLPPLVFGHWGWPNQHDHIPEDVHKKGEIQQWFLISAPQHPVWDEVLYDVVENIERYDQTVDGVGKFAVLKITGPIAMSRTLYPLLSQHPHLHVKDTQLGMLYDCLGGHEKKQTMMGSGTHYSKLKEPIVLYKIRPDPPPPPHPALAAGAAPVPGLIIREEGNVTYIPPREL